MKHALIRGFLYESYCLPKFMVHGKLHTSSSSNSSSSCHELESENEILKSQNAYLLSKVAAKSKVIKETAKNLKKSCIQFIEIAERKFYEEMRSKVSLPKNVN